MEIIMKKKCSCSKSSFFQACEDGDVELIERLVTSLNINALQPDGFIDDNVHHPAETQHLSVSPFLRAAQKGHRHVLPVLIRNGADLTKGVTVALQGIEPFSFSINDVLRASRSCAANNRFHPALEKYVLPMDMVDYIESISSPKPLCIARHDKKSNIDLSSRQRGE